MNVLFILKESVMIERIGVMYLSAALKKRGHGARLVMSDTIGIEALREVIRVYQPRIVAYSTMTGEHVTLAELNRTLKKEFDFISVFGGPHPTFSPDFINEDGVDAICIGEGDVTFPEFCERADEKRAYWDTPNFWVKHNNGIVKNEIAPLVEDLDILPFPDREFMYEADPALANERYKVFRATRGCPYRCTYCFNNKYNELHRGKGSVLRHRSPENLIDEICSVRKRYPLDMVGMDDDSFPLKPKGWFERFSKLYKERVGLPLSVNLRANLVTEEFIALLKDIGLDSIWMGIECGEENVSNTVLERNLKNEQILKAAAIIKKYDIKIATQNLIGLPIKESYQTDLATLDLNIKIGPAFAWSSILYPYPGTPIESYARNNGFLKGEVPFLATNKRYTVFNFSAKEKRRIENLHKLFGLIVRFPVLRKCADFLCSLPLGSFYVALFYFWYGYNMKFKLYPIRSLRKELGNYLRLWWRFIHKN